MKFINQFFKFLLNEIKNKFSGIPTYLTFCRAYNSISLYKILIEKFDFHTFFNNPYQNLTDANFSFTVTQLEVNVLCIFPGVFH